MKNEKINEEILCDKLDDFINELGEQVKSLETTYKLFNLSDDNHKTIEELISVLKIKMRKLEKAKYREDIKKVVKLKEIYRNYESKNVGY